METACSKKGAKKLLQTQGCSLPHPNAPEGDTTPVMERGKKGLSIEAEGRETQVSREGDPFQCVVTITHYLCNSCSC